MFQQSHKVAKKKIIIVYSEFQTNINLFRSPNITA